jgi:putative membrane protein
MPDRDPRVFFAAERTLLAWVRTGLGLIGMGFVVAKFGLFFRLLHPTVGDHADHSWAVPVGVALALLGSLASGVAAWQHRRFYRTLAEHELPRNYRGEPGLILGFGSAIVGGVLAGLLMV